MWKDRPQLINIECVAPSIWLPSVHYIEKQDTIVLIALDTDRKSRIAMVFYETNNFYEVQRIVIERNHYECAMIVNET